MIRVTVVCESLEIGDQARAVRVYPEGIEGALASFLQREADFFVRAMSFRETSFSVEWLADTDVLVWWDHFLGERLEEPTLSAIRTRVAEGMGLIVLHSAMFSRVFTQFTGLDSYGSYRESGERERVWIIDRSHPIVSGLPESFLIEHTEVYAEPTNLPTPEELIAISWYPGGEVMRSAFTLRRGAGRIFVFTPGHEEFPIYYQPEVMRILTNAVHWAYAPGRFTHRCGERKPAESCQEGNEDGWT